MKRTVESPNSSCFDRQENGRSPLNGNDPRTSSHAEAAGIDNYHRDDRDEDDDARVEEIDDGEIVNDFEDDDDDDDEEGDEGIAVSNFVWQACYPAKLNQSFSMEVIEEESEYEEVNID